MTYRLVMVQFPCRGRMPPHKYFGIPPEKYEPATLEDDLLRFREKDIWVAARGRFSNAASGKAMVVKDLATIDDIFPEIIELAEQLVVDDVLVYLKYFREFFEVIDYSLMGGNRLFDRVIRLRDPNYKSADHPSIREIQESVAPHIRRRGGQLCRIEGNSLREAVERALKVYRLHMTVRALI